MNCCLKISSLILLLMTVKSEFAVPSENLNSYPLSLTASAHLHKDVPLVPGTEHFKIILILMTHLPLFCQLLRCSSFLLQYLNQSLDPLFLPSNYLSHVTLSFHYHCHHFWAGCHFLKRGLLGQHPHWFSCLPSYLRFQLHQSYYGHLLIFLKWI